MFGPLFSFIWLLERAVADRLVADEVDASDLDLRPFVDVEGEVDQLRAAGTALISWRDLGELIALLGMHVADDALDLADEAGIDERVEADLMRSASFSFSSIFDISTFFEPT